MNFSSLSYLTCWSPFVFITYVPSGAPTNETVYLPLNAVAWTEISSDTYSPFSNLNSTSFALIEIDGWVYPFSFAVKAPSFKAIIFLPTKVSS